MSKHTDRYEMVLSIDYVVLCEQCDRIMRFNGNWICDQCGAVVTVHKKKVA